MFGLPHHLSPVPASQDLKAFGALWTWRGLDLKKRTLVVVVSDAAIATTGSHPTPDGAATGLDEPPGRHKRSRRSGCGMRCVPAQDASALILIFIFTGSCILDAPQFTEKCVCAGFLGCRQFSLMRAGVKHIFRGFLAESGKGAPVLSARGLPGAWVENRFA